MLIRSSLIVLLVLVCTGRTDAVEAEKHRTLITNARILDESSGVIDARLLDVLVEAGIVVKVSEISLPQTPDLKIYDATDKVLMGSVATGKLARFIVLDRSAIGEVSIWSESDATIVVIQSPAPKTNLAVTKSGKESVPATEVTDNYRTRLDTQKIVVPSVMQSAPWKAWHGYSGTYFDVGVSAAALLDRTLHDQDQDHEALVGDLSDFESGEIRALRLLVAGQIKFQKPWTYLFSAASRTFDRGFDQDEDDSISIYDLAVNIPTPAGKLTVGRQKEPISIERLMTLINGHFLERPSELDTLLRSRSDGLRLSDTALDGRLTWAAGVYNSWLSDNADFGDGNVAFTGRLTGLPYNKADGSSLLHLGLSYRYSDLGQETVRLQTVGEAHNSDILIDTGEFPADSARWLGLEASYVNGPLWLAGEYLRTDVDSPQVGDPVFSGYHISANWLLAGRQRIYNPALGILGPPLPTTEWVRGGRGLWEVAARYSNIDLDDQGINGGELSTIALGLRWHPSLRQQFSFNLLRARLERQGLEGFNNSLLARWTMLYGR